MCLIPWVINTFRFIGPVNKYFLANFNLEVGLLINFWEMSLNFKRLTNKKFKSSESQKSNKS